MGADIYCYAERLVLSSQCNEPSLYPAVVKPYYENVTNDLPEFLFNRSYSLFGFLAGVRNYSKIKPISEPRGLPIDVSDEVKELAEYDSSYKSWLALEELLNYDYEQYMEDRRYYDNSNGGATCEVGKGLLMTLREFLGEHFFKDLNMLKENNVTRIVFWFD